MKTVDLFSGCGGLSLGFGKAGFQIGAAIEYWDHANSIYQSNFDHPVFTHDLSDTSGALKIIEKFRPKMIIGGPPCQDFSSAGKRDESLGRADLTISFAEIVCQYKPAWFVMENVQRIVKSGILSKVIKQFESSGYGLTAVVLDASFCGVPQARQRFFLIGRFGDSHNFLLKTLSMGLRDTPMTMREYFGDKLNIDYYYRHPRNYNRRAVYGMDEPSATIRGVNRPVPKGYKCHPLDPVDVREVEVRPLTTSERAQVQTFPKSFKFLGNKTSVEQMIGNAVPPALAKFVGRAIIKYESDPEKFRTEETTLFGRGQLLIPKSPLHKQLNF
jgi:DNA (cytosine-5)-methyltransferase 1